MTGVRRCVYRLAADQSGAVMVEYAVVTMVGLTIAMALLGLGVALVDAIGASLRVLYSEYP
jgi:Flp pilus assembly pilin Flp